MSQQIVLQLLQELGGIATVSEIARLASQKYPDLSLSYYVTDVLRKLKKWGFVGYDVYTNKYFVVKEEEISSKAR
jgi:Fe2+ or Zn2+ uptake regulation protein